MSENPYVPGQGQSSSTKYDSIHGGYKPAPPLESTPAKRPDFKQPSKLRTVK